MLTAILGALPGLAAILTVILTLGQFSRHNRVLRKTRALNKALFEVSDPTAKKNIRQALQATSAQLSSADSAPPLINFMIVGLVAIGMVAVTSWAYATSDEELLALGFVGETLIGGRVALLSACYVLVVPLVWSLVALVRKRK